MASYPITELVKALFDSNYSQMIEEPGEVRMIFREGDLCIDMGNDNNQGFDDTEFWDAFVNILTFPTGNFLLGTLISSNPAVSTLLTAQGLAWSLAHCVSNVSCCEAVDGPVILEIPNTTIRKIWERMNELDIPINANGQGTVLVPTGDLQFKVNGILETLPVISPIPITEKFIDDDNVRMLHELAILGNIWSAEYISNNSYQSALVHLPMMQDILNEEGALVSTTNSRIFYSELLEKAPCVGPWADPSDVNHLAPEWASANRLFQPGNRNSGAVGENGQPDEEYRGYFPGIDYMVIYNLYHMLWADELPAYQRTTSCECIQEITTSEVITFCGLAKVAFLPRNFIRRTALQLYEKLSYEALNRHFCQTAVTGCPSVFSKDVCGCIFLPLIVDK
jgi:hypothetical protein